jgi:hypothetical protein
MADMVYNYGTQMMARIFMEQTAERLAEEAAKEVTKVAVKEVTKVVAKEVTKEASKEALKKQFQSEMIKKSGESIPFIGGFFSVFSAGCYIYENPYDPVNYGYAIGSLVAGMVSNVPIVGTTASFGINAALVIHKVNKKINNQNPNEKIESKHDTNFGKESIEAELNKNESKPEIEEPEQNYDVIKTTYEEKKEFTDVLNEKISSVEDVNKKTNEVFSRGKVKTYLIALV